MRMNQKEVSLVLFTVYLIFSNPLDRMCCLQASDDCSGSDEESVEIFKEYALGQLQIWIKTTVQRSRAVLAFSQAEP